MSFSRPTHIKTVGSAEKGAGEQSNMFRQIFFSNSNG
jgi:hypothetical protein